MKQITLAEMMGKDKLEELANYFGYLHDRWQDEKHYEDFTEYQKAIANHLKKSCRKASGANIISMTKRPFRVIFWFHGLKAYFKANAKQVEYGFITAQRR